MRIALFIAVMLLLCGVRVFADSPQNNKTPNTTANQITNNYQQGTEQSPIVVKFAPAILSKEETESDAKEKKEKLNNENRIVALTYGLAVIGFFQLVVFGWQARRLRQTVEATEKAVKSTQDSVRPFVFVEVTGVISDSTPGFKICNYIVTLKNLGNTPAILTGHNLCFAIGHDPHPPLRKTDYVRIPSGSAILATGECRDFPKKSDEFPETDNMKLCCYGRFEYDDIFKLPHYTKFCWDFQDRTSRNNFFPSDKEDLNEYT